MRVLRRQMSQNIHLTRLQYLLENLPESLPYHDLDSTKYAFYTSDDDVKEYGDEASATNHQLEVIFGARQNTGGIVPIKERGPGICAVVSFLAKCPLPDAQIELWVNNLCSSAEKLYGEMGKKVRTCLLIPQEQGLPEDSYPGSQFKDRRRAKGGGYLMRWRS